MFQLENTTRSARALFRRHGLSTTSISGKKPIELTGRIRRSWIASSSRARATRRRNLSTSMKRPLWGSIGWNRSQWLFLLRRCSKRRECSWKRSEATTFPWYPNLRRPRMMCLLVNYSLGLATVAILHQLWVQIRCEGLPEFMASMPWMARREKSAAIITWWVNRSIVALYWQRVERSMTLRPSRLMRRRMRWRRPVISMVTAHLSSSVIEKRSKLNCKSPQSPKIKLLRPYRLWNQFKHLRVLWVGQPWRRRKAKQHHPQAKYQFRAQSKQLAHPFSLYQTIRIREKSVLSQLLLQKLRAPITNRILILQLKT